MLASKCCFKPAHMSCWVASQALALAISVLSFSINRMTSATGNSARGL